jgi:hypothetical protein
MDNRSWRLTIGRNHYYLTEQEKTFYLTSISAGQDFVVLKSGKILSKQFMDLVPLNAIEEAEKLDAGKWECEWKHWHSKGAECACMYEYIEVDGKIMQQLKDSKKSLAASKSI